MIRQLTAAICFSLIAFQASAACTDFSGTWKGQCRDNSGQTRNLSLSIMQNGCDTVVIGDRIFPVGKVIETRIPNGQYNVSYEVVNFVNNCSDLQYLYTGFADVPGQPQIRINTSTTYKRNGRFMVSDTYQSENNYHETCQYFQQ